MKRLKNSCERIQDKKKKKEETGFGSNRVISWIFLGIIPKNNPSYN